MYCVFACLSVSALCVCSAYRSQKKALNPPSTELQGVVNCFKRWSKHSYLALFGVTRFRKTSEMLASSLQVICSVFDYVCCIKLPLNISKGRKMWYWRGGVVVKNSGRSWGEPRLPALIRWFTSFVSPRARIYFVVWALQTPGMHMVHLHTSMWSSQAHKITNLSETFEYLIWFFSAI